MIAQKYINLTANLYIWEKFNTIFKYTLITESNSE
jgi:hypothetical protein